MPLDFEKARSVVHQNGTLFERAIFAWLFENGSAERVRQIASCYKNPDNGFGHGLEHDIRAPMSNPLALEYLLGVMRHTGLQAGNLLDGSAHWVESQMDEAGNLRVPAGVRDYPMAPWWIESGGQTMPDSIVGNLIHFGCATSSLIEKTKAWAAAYHTPDSIRENNWLFMAYHAFDFFFAIDDFPQLDLMREAAIDNIVALAKSLPDNQRDSLFAFAPTPDSIVAKALPASVLSRCLDHLDTSQQPEGNWIDQHNLPQWYAMTTINALLALQRHGRCTNV